MVEFVVECTMVYALAGALFALLFAWRGAAAIDPVARHATLGFRLLVLPGAALLWPVLALRWWRAGGDAGAGVPGDRTDKWQPASERLRSRALIAWLVLAPAIALVLAISLKGALRARAGGAPLSRDAERLPAAKAGAR